MRALCLCSVMAVVGCGKGAVGTNPGDATGGVSPKQEEAKKISSGDPVAKNDAKATTPLATKSEYDFAFSRILSDYYKNELSADVVYLGKYGTITITKILELSKNKDGPFLATQGVDRLAHSNGYFYFREDQKLELAKLKLGRVDNLKIFGKCSGKQADGVNRGAPGFEFRVNFADCVIVK